MNVGRVLAAWAFFALGACSEAAPSSAPAEDAKVEQIAMPSGDLLSYPVDRVGPFHVGYRTRELTYTPPGQAASRTITVDLWYPTLDADGEHPKYISIFQDDDVLLDASLAPPVDPKGYPVHVYSHGSSGFGGTSPDLAHYFASHGWVFIAPNHLGNTLGSPEGKRPVALYYMRSTDVSASLDMLEHLDGGDPLAGKCRTARVVMSGHSFGGYTTWPSGGATFDLAAIQAKCDAGDSFTAPCRPEELEVFRKGVADARIAAAIPMAGGNFDFIADAGWDAAKRPYLLMSGSDDVSGQHVYERVTTLDLTWLEFQGGCHQLFALGGCPKFEEKLGWSLVNTHALAFARRYVLGDTSARTTKIVSGEESLSDRITFRHKGSSTPPAAP